MDTQKGGGIPMDVTAAFSGASSSGPQAGF